MRVVVIASVRNCLCGAALLTLLMSIRCAIVDSDLEIFVDELLQNYKGNGTDVPGAAVLVVYNHQSILRRAYGFANLNERDRVTPMTNFRLASITKQFTAAAILLLAEENNSRLKLDDRIRQNWFPTLPSATDAITVRHLLTHTSGLIDYEDEIDPNLDPAYQLTDSDVLHILSEQNQTYFSPPGTQFRYSNSGYALLALLVQLVSEKTFAQFLRERIFLPLGMNETVAYENGISTISHRAFGYSSNGAGWKETDQSQTSAVLGDGGIYSSIDDLVKWDAALYDNRLLSMKSLELAFTPAVRTEDSAIQYGMGWRISGDMLWHSGETIGFRNVILRFPKQSLTIIVLTNRNSPTPYQVAVTIAHRLYVSLTCDAIHSSSFFTGSNKTLVIFSFIMYFFFFRY